MNKQRSIDKAIELINQNEKFDNKRLAIAIRQRITEENDAINSYESLIPHITSPRIASIIQDIANEEKVHVGELQEILWNLDPDELSKEIEGRRENG